MTATDQIPVAELERVRDAAQMLNISRTKLYGMMAAGQIEYVRIGGSRRIPRAAIVGLIQRNLVARSDG